VCILIAIVVLYDAPGMSALDCAAVAAQPSLIRASDHDPPRHELSSSQFKQVYGFDPAADPVWAAAQLEKAGRGSDLPVVAEERSDDDERGVFAGDDVARRLYSCDHCHCSVCKRSLEHHECQLSVSSSSEHEVMSDDDGGSVAWSHLSLPSSLLLCIIFSW